MLHDLPFHDGSVDCVIAQAVLEHVLDPYAVVDEMYRVLGDRGLVYSDTPFMVQVHGREFDFTRFTFLGHRRLFRQFSLVASGVTCGPGMALAWTLRYFLLSFFESQRLRALVSGFSRCAFFWLKYFDYFLIHRSKAAKTPRMRRSICWARRRASEQVALGNDRPSSWPAMKGGF